MNNSLTCNTICVSGFFDVIHIGHIRLFKDAKNIGKELVVILNTDGALIRKKGYVFMPFKERKEILESIQYVDKVVKCIDEDQSVCKTLEMIMPQGFANGGDVNKSNCLERQACKELGIKLMFNVGGGKIQSSSKLVEKFKERQNI